jgi:hypothetical protein
LPDRRQSPLLAGSNRHAHCGASMILVTFRHVLRTAEVARLSGIPMIANFFTEGEVEREAHCDQNRPLELLPYQLEFSKLHDAQRHLVLQLD